MPTLGIELSDAGFLTAAAEKDEPRMVDVADASGSAEWPGYCYVEGSHLRFGRAAEDMWFVHPRRVDHHFWARLSHEPSAVSIGGRPPASSSELAFFFLREFAERLRASGQFDKIVLALPGSYLKDTATEEEKIGLLLGMAGELKLPVSGLIDLACAALCDPRASGFNPALPVVVIDLQLEGGDLTFFNTEGSLTRRDYIHLPQAGLAQLLKHLTGTMGNRFLRHTAFDILEDGRIEQTFFRQTKDFLFSGAGEYRFHINTATRAYEMVAKREQLAIDAGTFVTGLVQSLQTFLHHSPHASDPVTLALTDRAAHLPGLEARLRAAGFVRLLRLPRGAAACGAACIGARRLPLLADLSDVPLETGVPLTDARRLATTQWDARLQKNREPGPRLAPTHAILGGIGHLLGRAPRFTIGLAELGADLALPPHFSAADDCVVPFLHEAGRFWFLDHATNRGSGGGGTPDGVRTPVDAGDRLTIRCGSSSADILFAHCPSTNGTRLD